MTVKGFYKALLSLLRSGRISAQGFRVWGSGLSAPGLCLEVNAQW